MTTIAELLRSVSGSGDFVSLVYNGGSHSGCSRNVSPLLVTPDELVAVEAGSSVKKTYKLAHISSVELADGLRAENLQAVPPASPLPEVPALSTLAQYIQYFRPELTAAGWHLYEDDSSFGVATRFKNGKPKKTPSVLIRYFGRSTEVCFNLDTDEEEDVPREVTGRERPWRIDSWRFKEGKTVRELSLAFAIFMAEARASNPATSKNVWAGH